MKLHTLSNFAADLEKTAAMPVLFLGHGNPMHAIRENNFTKGWSDNGQLLPKPKAIVVVSAHWETRGTFVTAMEHPKTIHDFGGFPKSLFDVQYPAPGSPQLAEHIKDMVHTTNVELDHQWGLDHGTWSVVKHLYPDADVPVIQLSMDYQKDAGWHYQFAKELSSLREKGILIIGSGNMVHNLRKADFNATTGFDWAIEANEKLKKLIVENNHQSLIQYATLGKEIQMAIPSPEHYIPLLYVLGLKTEKDRISIFNDQTELGAISMTSIKMLPLKE